MKPKNKSVNPKRIIRGAIIEGVTTCPTPQISPESSAAAEDASFPSVKKNLRHKITQNKLKDVEWEEVWREGVEEGYRRGLYEGQKQGYEAGKEEGYNQGYIEGSEKTKAELKVAIELTHTIASKLNQKKEEMYVHLKPEMIKFALAVCEKLLRRELAQSEVFIDTLESLLEQAKGILKETPIQVFLSPADRIMLNTNMKNMNDSKDFLKSIDFFDDPHIQKGDCRIETPLGLINYDINRLLLNLEEKVLGEGSQ